jgi:predicted Rossmann fold nucleotide-binding protein DprA/Smf involved in DNA uptake
MKVIIAGSRNISNYKLIEEAIERSGWKGKITSIVSGGAKGMDEIGILWAQKNKLTWSTFYPEYSRYGQGAPLVRNRKMAEFADALIAIWDGFSSGTANMVTNMVAEGKPVVVVRLGKTTPKKESCQE